MLFVTCMIKKVLAIFTILALLPSSKAAVRVALVSGNWETAAVWGGSVPTCNDSVVIPAARVITVTTMLDYTGCGGPMKINVGGELTFNTGKKLQLACGSVIYVQSGGSITSGGGGGSSNLIDICGNTVWTAGMGPVSGPAVVTQSGITPLPVELIAFTASTINNIAVKLSWTTATETNNHHFDIERSFTGNQFTKIAEVPAKGDGNSLLSQCYEFVDQEPAAGICYYRLRQVDRNGASEYFPIVSVNFVREKNITFSVRPNPNKGEFTVDFSGIENNHEVQILLTDADGNIVYKHVLYAQADLNSVNIMPAERISNGVYFCSLVLEEIKYTVKVLVN
jgi:hypothetical protein